MKITLVISSLTELPGGGAERVISNMANFWADTEHKVTLITFDNGNNPYYLLSENVNWVALDFIGSSNNWIEGLINNVKRIFTLRNAIVKSAPDSIISFLFSTNILVLMATRFLSTNVIISERNSPTYHRANRRIWHILRRLIYPCAEHLVVQTRETGFFFANYNRSVKAIPNSVIVLPEKMKQEPGFSLPPGKRIVAMGGLIYQKGFDLLLNIVSRLFEKFVDWNLIIMGKGALDEELKNQAIMLGIENKITFTGRVMDPYSVLYRCDIFVLSSRYEGFPNALLEAMVCGLPPVSFDCPSGPGEIIKHGVNGLLVPPGDVKALEESLYVLMQDGGLRSNLGKEAIKVRKRFAIDKIMKQWNKIIT
jgi:glycosyltransferase involved in cell wall biosynthesis